MSKIKKETVAKLTYFSKTLKVLYVEDSDAARKSTTMMLDNFFDQITVAENGMEGLEKFNNYSFDLILTDIKMPNMDGIEMVSKIREQNKEIPVIVLSAHNESKYFLDMIKLKVDGFLLKPIFLDQFMNTILEVIEKLNLKKENENYKNNLEKLVEKEIKRREDQEILLAQTAKMAAVGEMVDSISHQWMQPLSIIKLQTQMYEMHLRENEDIKEIKKLDDFITSVDRQIEHLLTTLNEFRDFFREGKGKTVISIESLIRSILFLLKDTLVKNTIETKVDIDENMMINVIPNEFKHIFINLINNSKDAFNENNIENRLISFHAYERDSNTIIEVLDNAGGIPDEAIEHIFKQNWSTKDSKKGTGIGLYMSKLIANKNHADIKVKNLNGGAQFTISVKKYSKLI
ncbi:MAG: response regulator [Campylobacterota bacterium]|nr:response regulator [Campylobacterota bacterium]